MTDLGNAELDLGRELAMCGTSRMRLFKLPSCFVQSPEVRLCVCKISSSIPKHLIFASGEYVTKLDSNQEPDPGTSLSFEATRPAVIDSAVHSFSSWFLRYSKEDSRGWGSKKGWGVVEDEVIG